MGFNSGFKGLINVLYVNKQEFSVSSWRSNQDYTKMHGQPTVKILFFSGYGFLFPYVCVARNYKVIVDIYNTKESL